jgi:drug/metabolite transporter (DMT)-like permease
MKTPGEARGLLFLLPVILLWAATPLLVSELSGELPILEVNLLATAFGVLALAAAAAASGRWRALRATAPGQVRFLLLLGLAGIFPYTLLYYLAFSLAPEAAGSVNIVNYLWPIWIVILSLPLLGERLTPIKLLGVTVSFAGVFVLVTGGRMRGLATGPWAAYAAAGIGAFFWGLFSVLSKRHRHEPLTAMLLYNVSALVGFTAVALIGAMLGAGRLALPSARAWLLLALLGGGVNALGYLFWTLALRHGETGLISSLVYLVPFVALAYLRLFRGRPVKLIQVAALILVLAGPLLQRVLHQPQRADR